jgi:DNA polymerase-1
VSNSQKPTLMIIDGHSLAFRAFYALPTESFQTRDGFYTNAIHGFLAMLINLLNAEQPDALAVAFDISRYSFRTQEYPEYKGTRGETPPEFKGQVPMLQEALHAMGIVTLEKENFEADDILATLAKRGADDGYRVLVVSGDRDTIQLVNDDVTLLYPSKQGVSELTRYDAEKVMERYGIRPDQYPDVAALVGETSDNLPGVPKVGEKTAVKWLTQYGSLQGILDHQDEIGGKVGESLREHAHLAVRNRKLNHLVRDVELDVEPAELARAAIDMDAVAAVFAKLEFRTLLTRVAKLAGSEPPTQGSPATIVSTGPTAAAEESDVAPTVKHLLDEELGAWLERESHNHPGGLALHTVQVGETVTVGVASKQDAVEFNWRTDTRDAHEFLKWLASEHPKIFFDAKSQLKAYEPLRTSLQTLAGDVLIGSWLLRPQTPDKSLDEIVYRYTGDNLSHADPNQLVPDEAEQTGPGLTAWYIARAHAEVTQRMDPGTLEVYQQIEVPLIPILAEMERVGIAVDLVKLEGLQTEFTERANEFQKEAFAHIGREVNLSSPKQLQEVLFEQLGMPKTRATKTGYTTDAAALAELQDSNPHPFLGALLAHRDTTKLKQIVEGLTKSIAEDGRIHTSFVQIGTSTGRLSSSDPNLQNIPIRTEDGRRIRDCFISANSYDSLLSADYSQIEMRIMAHLSADDGLIEAFNLGEDLHRFVGSRIFGVPPDEVTADMRGKVKAMSYGLAYGLSAYGLAKQLAISPAEAKTLMGDYFARFGGVRDYLRSVVEEARANRFTVTLYGRRRPFPDLGSPNRVLRENAERAALNAPIQGTAADIMKRAMIAVAQMIRAHDLRSRMLLQVHDELIFEVADGEWETLEPFVVSAMAQAAELSVPLDVHVGRGHSWHDAEH